jgi:hypothetical protein
MTRHFRHFQSRSVTVTVGPIAQEPIRLPQSAAILSFGNRKTEEERCSEQFWPALPRQDVPHPRMLMDDWGRSCDFDGSLQQAPQVCWSRFGSKTSSRFISPVLAACWCTPGACSALHYRGGIPTQLNPDAIDLLLFSQLFAALG